MRRCRKWIFTLLTILLMAIIFFFSAQPGAASSSVSHQVSDRLQSSSIGKTLSPAWFSRGNANANTRKWAHIYLYAAFGASMAVTVRAHVREKRRPLRRPLLCGAGLTVLLCFAYAATDEFHQLFIPGRAAAVGDVLIDSLGFLPMILLVNLLYFVGLRRQGRHGKTAV